jgi:hypothetical protein
MTRASVGVVEWHDAPDGHLSEWRGAETQVFETGAQAPCPEGDGATLRFFFLRTGSLDPSRGSFWIWCPRCRGYEHASATVPDWWIDVAVPVQELTHHPGWLDEHWDDEWLSRQPMPR